jgi:hypothetical protein
MDLDVVPTRPEHLPVLQGNAQHPRVTHQQNLAGESPRRGSAQSTLAQVSSGSVGTQYNVRPQRGGINNRDRGSSHAHQANAVKYANNTGRGGLPSVSIETPPSHRRSNNHGQNQALMVNRPELHKLKSISTVLLKGPSPGYQQNTNHYRSGIRNNRGHEGAAGSMKCPTPGNPNFGTSIPGLLFLMCTNLAPEEQVEEDTPVRILVKSMHSENGHQRNYIGQSQRV